MRGRDAVWTVALSGVVLVLVLGLGVVTEPVRTGMYGDFEAVDSTPVQRCPVLASKDAPAKLALVASSTPSETDLWLGDPSIEEPWVHVACYDWELDLSVELGWHRDTTLDDTETLCLVGSHGVSCVATLGRSDAEIKSTLQIVDRREWRSIVERTFEPLDPQGRYPWLRDGGPGYYDSVAYDVFGYRSDGGRGCRMVRVFYGDVLGLEEELADADLDHRIPEFSAVGAYCFDSVPSEPRADRIEQVSGDQLIELLSEPLHVLEKWSQ